MAEKDKGKVEELNDDLYSRTRYQDPLDKRTPVHEIDSPTGGSEVEEKWQTTPLDEILARERLIPSSHPFMKKLFIFALLFFVATVFIAGFMFMGGTNFISSKNVDISVLGPTSVSAGEIIELGVTIENKNNADLEVANFSVQYPQGSRNPEDTGNSLTFTKEELGIIGAGEDK